MIAFYTADRQLTVMTCMAEFSVTFADLHGTRLTHGEARLGFRR
jgi:hypothetical protein